MSGVLKKENIILNAAFSDKIEAIKCAGQILVQNSYVQAPYIDSMLERDRDLSVYIGNGVAIPHGMPDSEPYILASGISVVQVPDGVAFDEGTAYVVMGIAGKNNTHVDILGQIAGVCMEEENVEKLRWAKSENEILEILQL